MNGIPIFVSSPARFDSRQIASVDLIRKLVEEKGPIWRQIGVMDNSLRSPIEEVLSTIKTCYGGIILGFERFRAYSGVLKRGTAEETIAGPQVSASPWHQIEATALLARELPVLIFKDPGVQEGLFDQGSSNMPIYQMPHPELKSQDWQSVFTAFSTRVRRHFDAVSSIFDVFVSFSGEDVDQARQVFEFFTSQGLRVFFSRESIPTLAQADYMKAINEAIDKARHMVVFSCSAEGFAKPWVEREWSMFLNEKLSKRKSGNIVVMHAGNINVSDLPIALRSQQVIGLSQDGLREALQFVSFEAGR